MKYSITKEQQFFFDKNLFIEFEELLSEDEVAHLLQGIKKALKSSPEKIFPEDIFLRGRDLIRLDETIQDVLFSPRLGQIARALSMSKRLRFGFDQLYSGPRKGLGITKTFSRLDEESCIQGLSCALMICLQGEVEQSCQSKDGIDPFPKKPGSGIFFLPTVSCNSLALQSHENQLFLLLTWTKERSLYVFQPKDPHNHALKKLGHVFGDRLIERNHPIIAKDV